MKVALLAIALVAIGAFVYWRHESCVPFFTERYAYMPAGPAPIARAFLIPGLDSTADAFMAQPTSQAWVTGMNKMGVDVVLLTTPVPKACWFRDGGRAYRAAFLKAFDEVAQDAAKVHGKPSRMLVAGISYGGLHTMVEYAAHPDRFIGWQASLPVTHLRALAELATVDDVPAFDAFALVPALRGTPGFLAWGDQDERVDYHLIAALAAETKSPSITTRMYPGVGHARTPQLIRDLLADLGRKLARDPHAT